MGPPLRKLSIKKLPVTVGPLGVAPGLAEAEADAAGVGERLPLRVALTLAPGIAGVIPGATEVPSAGAPGAGAPGAPGAVTGALPAGGGSEIAGLVGAPGAPGATAAGLVGAAGLAGAAVGPLTGAFGGGLLGGAAGRVCANAQTEIKLRQRVSSVFISAAMDSVTSWIARAHLYPKGLCNPSS